MNQLTIFEISELQKHEEVIERGLQTFVEVGQSLLSIRDSKLYREEYGTFEDYCRERWGMARQRAHQLMEASLAVSNLSTVVDILPSSERQTRPLSSLEPEQQREVWAEVVATHEPKEITAAVVKETVERITKPHVSHNSGENEWYTPIEFIEAAREVMGSIDLDPASCELANQTVGAHHFFTKEDDGLVQDWGGNVWINPPYAQPLMSQFAEKIVEQKDNYNQCIVLVNNATETRWFQSIASVASAFCFPQGRIRYNSSDGPKNSPLQGQAFLYIGNNCRLFHEVFEAIGFCVYRNN